MEILDQSAGTAINTSEQAQPILEAEHLRKIFPLRQANPLGTKQGVHAVDDASLALYPGRVMALVGESGRGKTTVSSCWGLPVFAW